MKRSLVFSVVGTMPLWCFAATTVFLNPAFGESAGQEKIVSGQVAAPELELRGLEVGSDGSVNGTVVNGSGVLIKDVKLLVTHAWSWSDERHPGEDNPGRAGFVRLTGEIPAKSSMAFAYAPTPPLPKRTDGSFQTTVAVQSFTEVGD